MADETQARPYRVVTCTADVAAPIDAAWRRVGGFLDIGTFLKVPCTYLAGSGDLGSVRLIAGAIVEPMVARTRYSYTYSQTAGTMAAHGYHGTLALEERADDACGIVYTLVYDETGIADEKRADVAAGLQRRFDGAVAAIKAAAEAATA